MTEYPTTLKDLAAFDVVKDQHLIHPTLRQHMLEGRGYDTLTIGRMFGISESEVQQQVYGGSLDRLELDGVIHPRSEVDLPAKAKVRKDDIGRLLRAVQILPTRRVAEPTHEAVAGLQLGTVDAMTVAMLRSNAKGHATTFAARNANAVRRVQACREYSVSPASLAEAAGCSAQTAYDWMTGVSVPSSDATITIERMVSYLMTGPQVGAVTFNKKLATY